MGFAPIFCLYRRIWQDFEVGPHMVSNTAAIVGKAVADLGFELVEFERAANGLLRVYLDKPGGISVDDCVLVSNQLTRIFAVEAVDFGRLEVSSPGLDRPLTRLQDFQRFAGSQAKVRLNGMVDGRKRFTGTIEGVQGEAITFALVDDEAVSAGKAGKAAKGKARPLKVPKALEDKTADAVAPAKKITVVLADIERARLVPVL